VIRHVYVIDYRPGGKRKFLWSGSGRSRMLCRLPVSAAAGVVRQRLLGDPPSRRRVHLRLAGGRGEDFGRKEIGLILEGELPAHSASIRIKVLALRDDYTKDTVAGKAAARPDQS
jgi:hypothetical protein